MKSLKRSLFLYVFFATPFATLNAAATEVVQTPYEEQKVVFEFYFDHPQKVATALYWLKAVYQTLSDDPYSYAPDFLDVKVVIHGTEIVTLARKNYGLYREIVERMRYYSELGAEFKVCSLSLTEYGYRPDDMQDFIHVIPSAVTELIHWQSKGYSLIVPKVWEKNVSLEEIQ
jgi:intracellular sulfur oxidation DsrE/DsrF family protein